jgi:DNA-binding transcriptional regulator PaaX
MARKRVDGNQTAIVSALRRTGWLVQSLAGLGFGVPDLMVYHRATDRMLLLELKTARGRITPQQRRLLDEGWPILIVRSVEEALAL